MPRAPAHHAVPPRALGVVQRFVGTPVLHLAVPALAELAAAQGVAVPPGLATDDASRDEWLNLLLAELVEPRLGVERPTFLYDYPASQAALAVIRDSDPPVAERFELYIDGVELCNGYHELLDANELRRRNVEQNAKRATLGLRTLPEIAAEAKGMTVMVDGGIRRGTDVIKALALGAHFVFVGRPFLYAAVAGGQPAVERAITLLHEEIGRDLALLGIRSLSEITPDLVRKF